MSDVDVTEVPRDVTWQAHHLARLLRHRHTTKPGGRPRWAYADEVRNRAGFGDWRQQTAYEGGRGTVRTFDAVALDLWPSGGIALHVFEIKVSRSDLRRELADPYKTQAALDVADHYWLVTSPSLTHGIDLPATWGLLEPRWQQGAWKLRATRTAPRLQSVPATIDRGLVVGMLHAGMRRI